jgi:hypothetical protein
MIFGEQVFEGESLLSVPAEPERTLTVPLAPARDAPVVLMIKALVGTKVRGPCRVSDESGCREADRQSASCV